MILQKRCVNSLLNGILTYQNIIVLFKGGRGEGGQKHCTAKLYKCLSYEPFTHIQGTILRAKLNAIF